MTHPAQGVQIPLALGSYSTNLWMLQSQEPQAEASQPLEPSSTAEDTCGGLTPHSFQHVNAFSRISGEKPNRQQSKLLFGLLLVPL